MITRPEWRFVKAFRDHFQRCGLVHGEVVCVLSESQSRPELVDTAYLAAESLGARAVSVVVPTPPSAHAVPIRSTGASQAIAANPAVIAALQACDLVLDCTVEGLLHSPELGLILGSGTRVLMISNEHLDTFDRIVWDPDMPRRVALGQSWLDASSVMHVTSDAGTDLTVTLAGAFTAGSTGVTDGPGSIAHWPGGLVLAFPAAQTTNGTIVLAEGDVNLTFNRYIERPISLTIVDDRIVVIEGVGLDVELFRAYLGAFDEADAYATSHVGWGMNAQARWETLALYDKRELWGTELRAFAGNFLYSCGANENAGRFSAGHFDLPMRNCTVRLDDRLVVEHGQLADELRGS